MASFVASFVASIAASAMASFAASFAASIAASFVASGPASAGVFVLPQPTRTKRKLSLIPLHYGNKGRALSSKSRADRADLPAALEDRSREQRRSARGLSRRRSRSRFSSDALRPLHARRQCHSSRAQSEGAQPLQLRVDEGPRDHQGAR